MIRKQVARVLVLLRTIEPAGLREKPGQVRHW